MRFPKATSTRSGATFAFLAALIFTAMLPAHAQTETVLYNFCSKVNCTDGKDPYAAVIRDKEGNLYGTTVSGGANNYGTVFKIEARTGVERVLYSFCSLSNCTDGGGPQAGVIMDKEGNLYGTTANGGAYGLGTVFELTPKGVESVLHSFAGCDTDGREPQAGLIMDKEGNLFGTTSFGGEHCANGVGGTVFEITSTGENLLFSFGGKDGSVPAASVISDGKGNLYGITSVGGRGGPHGQNGIVFKLPTKGGEDILYSFTGGTDGQYPSGALLRDNQGNLYGTTYYGGVNFYGTVFKITPTGEESILYSFGSDPTDGRYPIAGLIMDSNGNLYGTTFEGGANSQGTIFELDSTGTETVLYSFQNGAGSGPVAGLVMDSEGNLYGTTPTGGAQNDGTVFEFTP
jgi:uncharacterized repeat protein (TIGR03803 family)